MPTILIVDDNADHRELLSIALRRHGHVVREAVDVSSALAAIDAGGLDAAMLDVRMPGGCGIELCRRLRDSPDTAHLPIMVVSADVCDSRIVSALRAGADDYLSKPFHRAELTTRLESVLRRRTTAGSRVSTGSRVTAAATAALLAGRASRRAALAMARPALADVVRIA